MSVGYINLIRYAIRIAMIDALRIQYLHKEPIFSKVGRWVEV